MIRLPDSTVGNTWCEALLGLIRQQFFTFVFSLAVRMAVYRIERVVWSSITEFMIPSARANASSLESLLTSQKYSQTNVKPTSKIFVAGLGLPLVSLWSPFGLPLVSLWSPFGLPLVSLWSPFGLPLVSLWSPFGLPLVSLWSRGESPLNLLDV